ncbi:hypothetical protein ED208_15345 [Stagnimonas aquatica]|uniref:Uncharacterized protein n=1 Tax=Stagnimonas aquatica TaxID=2689987 RepID=A0A3N0V1C8_9GAMM|nr:hypothetical protein [Stagnimonas aquatica]ROH86412.1 hypothetical protein ED208_15345 [Stagnimonas aquatica]
MKKRPAVLHLRMPKEEKDRIQAFAAKRSISDASACAILLKLGADSLALETRSPYERMQGMEDCLVELNQAIEVQQNDISQVGHDVEGLARELERSHRLLIELVVATRMVLHKVNPEGFAKLEELTRRAGALHQQERPM